MGNKLQIVELLQEMAAYERLLSALPGMYQKSQVILLWTYTRDQRLLEDPQCLSFIEKVVDAMLHYESQIFKMDNFDILLLVQSINHLTSQQTQEFASENP